MEPTLLGGADTAPAAGGEDTVTTGEDTVSTGEDTVEGGAGEDTAEGGEGKDTVEGGETPDLFGAPDDGAYALNLPEGMDADPVAFEAAKGIGAKLGLSQAGMDLVVKEYAEQVMPKLAESVSKQVFEGINNDIAQRQQSMIAASTTMIQGGKDADGKPIAPDPAFGGKPMKDVMSTAAKAIDRFGGTDLRAFFDETGMGNDPRVVKAWYQIGSLISEDTDFGDGGGSAPNTKPKTLGELYYPKG